MSARPTSSQHSNSALCALRAMLSTALPLSPEAAPQPAPPLVPLRRRSPRVHAQRVQPLTVKVNQARLTRRRATPSSSPTSSNSLSLRPPVRSVSLVTFADLPRMATYLGQRIPIVNGGQVKGGVVAILTALLPPYSPHQHTSSSTSSSAFPHHPHPIPLPSFNRMSGLLHLRNAICLFVNLRASHYDNQFSVDDAGMRLTWFAARNTRPDSELVRRLKTAREKEGWGGEEEEEGEDANGEGAVTVLLFCREVGSAYRCYGRLGYDGLDASTRPMRFTWRLLDWQRLRQLDEESRAERQ